MENDNSRVVEQIDALSRTFNCSFGALLFVAAASIVTMVWLYMDDMCNLPMVIVIAVVAIGTICWLRHYAKQTMGTLTECRRTLFDTELAFYRDGIRRKKTDEEKACQNQ